MRIFIALILMIVMLPNASAETAQDCYDRASAESDEGKVKCVIDDYSRAIELDPNFAMAYYRRGHIWVSLGNMKNALDDFKQAIAINPNLQEAQNCLAGFQSDPKIATDIQLPQWVIGMKKNWNRKIDSKELDKIKPGTPIVDVFANLGPPEKDIGSGIHIYEYKKADGSKVMIGSISEKVLYVRSGN